MFSFFALPSKRPALTFNNADTIQSARQIEIVISRSQNNVTRLRRIGVFDFIYLCYVKCLSMLLFCFGALALFLPQVIFSCGARTLDLSHIIFALGAETLFLSEVTFSCGADFVCGRRFRAHASLSNVFVSTLACGKQAWTEPYGTIAG